MMGKFIAAVAKTPSVQLRYMSTELSRGLKRIKKSFIKTQLQGPPGIKGGQLTKGKNVVTFVDSKSLKQLGGAIRISRLLHVHDKGLTIRAAGGKKLYLREKGQIVAVVDQVKIPKRLHFESQVRAEAPAVLVRVGKAATRATHDTLKKALVQGAR